LERGVHFVEKDLKTKKKTKQKNKKQGEKKEQGG